MTSSANASPDLPTIMLSSMDHVDPAYESLLAVYRNQKDAWLRVQRQGGRGLPPTTPPTTPPADGLFLAEGELVVRKLLTSPTCHTQSVLCTPTRLAAMADALAHLSPSVPIFVAPRPILASIIGFDLHRGILAAGYRLTPPTAGPLIEDSRTLILCENLANHDNLGAIFRNVATLAGDRAAILLSPASCDPLYRKSIRVSMGHALGVPFATLDPWLGGLDAIGTHTYEIFALTPAPDAIPIQSLAHAIKPSSRLALMLGAEGPGLSAQAMNRATQRVQIPMQPGTDSLNVATALAVALSHLRAVVSA